MAKILIIEDEKILAEMYKDKLEEAGHEADLVFSSEEATGYLKKKKPDLILLDILLPKENGTVFLKKIRKIKKTADIPVVAFSNYDEPKTKKETLDLGAKDYLIKTAYTPQQLVDQIKNFLR